MEAPEKVIGPILWPRPIDPSPEMILDRRSLAILKAHKIGVAIEGYKANINILEMELKLIREEHKIDI
jgi:hypothetical protein